MTNFLKRSWLHALALPVLLGGILSCSDDDKNYPAVDNQAPIITLASDKVQTEAGRAFTIEANIKDADGIKSINLKNESMYLDKTINLRQQLPRAHHGRGRGWQQADRYGHCDCRW